MNYVIRQNYTTLPNTNLIRFRNGLGLNTAYQKYLTSGFLSLQQAVDDWAFEYTDSLYDPESNADVPAECTGPPRAVLTPYPTAAYDSNEFYRQVGFLLGLAMVMATMYPLSRLVKSMVEEKELKLKEVMKIMGLKDWVHQLSWFIASFVLFLWIAVSFTFLSSISFLSNSNPVLLFFYFFFFCMAEVTLGFFINVFFSNSKLAAIVAPIVLFAMLLPRYIFLNTNDSEQVPQKIFVSVFCPTAFAFGADIIADFENGGVGLQWDNIATGDYNFATVLGMLLLDFFLYALLAWYLEQVLPHEYGVAQPPLFFLNWRYWWPRSNSSSSSGSGRFSEELEHMPEFYGDSDTFSGKGLHHNAVNDSVEPIPLQMRHNAVVRIKNMKKRYSNGKVAVNKMSLSMLQNQITCLLGHNGAGAQNDSR